VASFCEMFCLGFGTGYPQDARAIQGAHGAPAELLSKKLDSSLLIQTYNIILPHDFSKHPFSGPKHTKTNACLCTVNAEFFS
jgi:hypothetical protein